MDLMNIPGGPYINDVREFFGILTPSPLVSTKFMNTDRLHTDALLSLIFIKESRGSVCRLKQHLR